MMTLQRLALAAGLVSALAWPASATDLEKWRKQFGKVAPASADDSKALCACMGGNLNQQIGVMMALTDVDSGQTTLLVDCMVKRFTPSGDEITTGSCRSNGGTHVISLVK